MTRRSEQELNLAYYRVWLASAFVVDVESRLTQLDILADVDQASRTGIEHFSE